MTAEHAHSETDEWSNFYAIPQLVRRSTRLIRKSQRDGTFDYLHSRTQIALRTLSDKRVPQEALEMPRKELRARTFYGLSLLREMHKTPKNSATPKTSGKSATIRV